MSGLVLEALDLYRTYSRGEQSVDAVRGITLRLRLGEHVSIVGPSGCGKSTLLHLCGAMDRPTRGDVVLEGQALSALDDGALTRLRRRRVGFVFQFFNLLPTLTVRQNVGLPLSLERRSQAEVGERVDWVVERVGLTSRIDHFPQQLSGGEAQRAAIARAVVHEPAILIADEPTGSLDSENGGRVLDLLMELNEQSDTALLLATHDKDVAARSGRVLYIRDGKSQDKNEWD